MRFISKARAFKKGVIKAQFKFVNNAITGEAERAQSRDPYIAIFQQGGATPREVELARERFQFKGIAEGENPLSRISVFDTDEEARRLGWFESDEAKKKAIKEAEEKGLPAPTALVKSEVEQILLAGQDANYFLAESEKAPKPWPSYDEADAGTILDVAAMVGVSLDQVLAYERDNKNRKTVVKAIEDKLGIKPESEVVVEA